MMATPIASSISISFLFSVFLFLCSSKKGFALQSHFHTVQISSLLPDSVCSPLTKDHNIGASLKVVDKHGPCSHLKGLDKKASTPTVTQILTHDQARVNSIQSRISFNLGRQNGLKDSEATIPAKSGSSIGSANYIVTVGLGTPKKDLSLIFDTGSDFTWTQCQQCLAACYQQQEKKFDPFLSTTYKNITCNSTQCSQVSSATSAPPLCFTKTCVYSIQYGDSSFSQGFFASETLTLTPSDVFPNFLFGCGENNQGLFRGAAGLLGLGRNPLSAVSQTASKFGKYFSYCLPSVSSKTGYLTFGKGGSSGALKFTPFLPNSKDPTFYFIDIIGIKINGKTLSISQSVFKTAGSLIDSGTVITRLPPAAYSPLRKTFRQLMVKYPIAPGRSILDTCYDLRNQTTVSLPSISILFGGNIEVPLDRSGILFDISASQFCLAFAPNSKNTDVGILGNVQQRTLDIVYDVAGGKLGFGSAGCS